MHDIVDLEIRGVPGVFVASSVFVDPPIQDRTDDEMRALAERAVDEILDKIRA